MVIVQGVVRVHPDDLEGLRVAAVAMMTATRAEPGCVAYAFAEDFAEPGLVHITERWRDNDALKAHFATPHMAAFNAAIGKARVLDAKVSAFDASNERRPGT